MKKHIVIIAAIVANITPAAHAYEINHISECIGGTCPSNGVVRNGVVYGHCTQSLCECTTAETSYALECHCEKDTDCDSGYGCASYGICTKCKTCSNCTSDSAYIALRTGYERRTIRICSCDGICNTSYKYQCAKGYFGTSTNGTSGCSQCYPPATTTAAGATQATQCYIPNGTTFNDTSGKGTYTGDCYYKN